MSLGIVRIDADRAAIRVNRLLDFALLLQRYGQVELGVGMVRLDRYRPPIRRLGFGQSSSLMVLNPRRKEGRSTAWNRGRSGCPGGIAPRLSKFGLSLI